MGHFLPLRIPVGAVAALCSLSLGPLDSSCQCCHGSPSHHRVLEFQGQKRLSYGCSWVVELLLSICKELASVPSTVKTEVHRTVVICHTVNPSGFSLSLFLSLSLSSSLSVSLPALLIFLSSFDKTQVECFLGTRVLGQLKPCKVSV